MVKANSTNRGKIAEAIGHAKALADDLISLRVFFAGAIETRLVTNLTEDEKVKHRWIADLDSIMSRKRHSEPV